MRILLLVLLISSCSHYQPVYPYGDSPSYSISKIELSEKTKEKNFKESQKKVEKYQKRVDYLSKKLDGKTYTNYFFIKKYEGYKSFYTDKLKSRESVKSEKRLNYYEDVLNDYHSKKEDDLEERSLKLKYYKAKLQKEIIRLESTKPSE